MQLSGCLSIFNTKISQEVIKTIIIIISTLLGDEGLVSSSRLTMFISCLFLAMKKMERKSGSQRRLHDKTLQEMANTFGSFMPSAALCLDRTN
jgi:hypothetical protein